MRPHRPSPRPRPASPLVAPALAALLAASAAAAPPRAAATPKPAAPRTEEVRLGAAELTLVEIPRGAFRMGTDERISDAGGWTNEAEHPAHEVRLTRPFWLGEVPVTQGQWQAVMGGDPSIVKGAGADAPVENVDFNDAQAFVARANATQSAWTFRLPTEAEWEYACRAGTTGETYGPLEKIAWYGGNGGRTTHPVAEKEPNAFGLYDMLGNVWQWCEDWYAPYAPGPATDPRGPTTGELRVTRGGCFYCDAVHCRAGRRNRDAVDHKSKSVGFRVAAEPRAR